jgi:hypothetical protein
VVSSQYGITFGEMGHVDGNWSWQRWGGGVGGVWAAAAAATAAASFRLFNRDAAKWAKRSAAAEEDDEEAEEANDARAAENARWRLSAMCFVTTNSSPTPTKNVANNVKNTRGRGPVLRAFSSGGAIFN